MSWSRLKMAKELHFYLFLLGDGVFSSKSKQLFFFFFFKEDSAYFYLLLLQSLFISQQIGVEKVALESEEKPL